MNEKIIFRYASKSLSAINNVKLFEGEKNIDYLEFLIPSTYNDVNILDCDIKLTYITPDNNEHYLLINNFVQEDTYKDYLRFVINIDENFTSVVGEVKMYLTFLKFDQKDIILKSSTTTVIIDKHPCGEKGITEEQLNLIDEILLRSNDAKVAAEKAQADVERAKEAVTETEKHAEATQKAAEETQKSAESISEELSGIRYLIIGEAEEVDF